MPAVVPSAEIHSDRILAEVLWIDHFGNAQLNIGPDDLSPLGERFTLKILGLPEPMGTEPGIPHIGIPVSPLAGTPQVGTPQPGTRQAGTPKPAPPSRHLPARHSPSRHPPSQPHPPEHQYRPFT